MDQEKKNKDKIITKYNVCFKQDEQYYYNYYMF